MLNWKRGITLENRVFQEPANPSTGTKVCGATQDGINTFQKVGIKLNLQDLEKSKEFVKFRYGTNDENENHQLPTQTLLSIGHL